MQIRMPSALADIESVLDAPFQDAVFMTSHVDIEPRKDGSLHLEGACRELRTTEGSPEVLGGSAISAQVGADRVLLQLEASPSDDRIGSLTGQSAGRGFRALVRSVFGDTDDADTSLRLLLDELPMAVLISGYAALYGGKIEIRPKDLESGVLRADICSGWRSDGTMLVTLAQKGRLPLPVGPSSTEFEASDDGRIWHGIGPLGVGNMRRRRLIEVAKGDPLALFAMFRDTYVDSDGQETVLHEYFLTAKVDAMTEVISNCTAWPRVLPWAECPWAASSASRLNGVTLGDLDSFVARELRGTATCTHLNDLLRSLSAVGTLLAQLG